MRITNQEKLKITTDTLFNYNLKNGLWHVTTSKNKHVGLFKSLDEALRKQANNPKAIEIFGVIEILNILGGNPKKVEALCFCGNKFITRYSDIKRGHTKSCGCIRKNKLRIQYLCCIR